jgi:fatty-acyl-CoA synthase
MTTVHVPSTARLDHVAHFARTTPDKVAVLDLAQSRSFTYSQLEASVEQASRLLTDRVGTPGGQRVAMVSRNRVEMLIVHFACIRCGAIFVPVNWRLAPPEVGIILADCQPALIIAEPEFAAHLAGAECPHIWIDASTAGLESQMAAAAAPQNLHAPSTNTPITLLYSSGTTGKPKGVIITLMNAFATSLNLALDMHCGSDSVFLCDMPLFHTAGLFAAARTPLSVGGTVLVSQKFDAPTTYRRLCDLQLGVTHYFCVTQMAMALRELPGFDGRRLARLTALITGGAPNPQSHIRQWWDDGVGMINAWGMSEIGSGTAQPLGTLERLRNNPSAIGLPHLTTEIRLVDSLGRDVQTGDAGEIWVQGWSVTPGYWERPDLNAQAFHEGWFRTGDVAIRDAAGVYTLVDRIKDMFISGGENVYPAEVEAVIAELPGVSEIAVFGVPHETWGETGAALVLIAQGSSLDIATVEAHCKARLAHFKVPRFFRLVETLPRTASGKIQKHVLREQWARHAGDQEPRPRTAN